MQMNVPLLPTVTPQDLNGVLALLAFLKDSDACEKRLAELLAAKAEADTAAADYRAVEQSAHDRANEAQRLSNELADDIEAHSAQKAADAKALSERAASLDAQASALAETAAQQSQTATDQAAKASALAAQEADLTARAVTLAADRKTVDTMRADLTRRLAIITQAQA